MAEGITFIAELDYEAMRAKFAQVGERALPRLNAACQVTTGNIQREARARLRRQLGPGATGKTEASIVARPHNTEESVHLVYTDRDWLPNLPLWLEQGTKPGKRKNRASTKERPFFYVSADLEERPHFHRIEDALQDTLDDMGLGV